MAEEQRFFIAIAYQPGKDPKIRKGQDGGRDYFTEAELEKAAHSFMRNGPRGGLFHIDGTAGAITYDESWIHRAGDWPVTGPDGTVTVVKNGTWLLAGHMDQNAWDLYKRGKLTGLSPQGTAKRLTRRSG